MIQSCSIRRRAFRLAYVQSVLWSIGNGLTSGTLLYYLALDLGATGLALSLILALPAFVGVLRMATPWLVDRTGSAKNACVLASTLSYSLLWVWLLGVWFDSGSKDATFLLSSLIGIVCLHQLLEYMAHAAWYAWIADLVPGGIRGRFLGVRNRWQLWALVPTSLLGGYFAQFWRAEFAESGSAIQLWGYLIPIATGSVMLLASIVPLLLMPASLGTSRRGTVGPFQPVPANVCKPASSVTTRWRLPFADRRFRGLLLYRGWFSFSNGITQAAQNIFPRSVLGFEAGDMAMLRNIMQLGQGAVSPKVGRWVDRWGNRGVLQVSQMLVACSLLFFALATTAHPWGRWVIAGAFVLWIAYAGINVGLYNLMLKLPPPGGQTPMYVSAHEAVGSACYGVSTIAGGLLLDYLTQAQPLTTLKLTWPITLLIVMPYGAMFLLGFGLRLIGVWLLARIDEPGAQGFRSRR